MIAPATSVDLAAERAASQARRDREHQDTSARVLIHLAATGSYLGGLEEWCEHQHPHWTPERRAALVARAREIQDEARPGPRTVRPPPCPSSESRNLQRALDATEDHMPRTAAAPTPAAEGAPERPSTSDVRRVITEILTADPTKAFGEVQAALEERYGVPFKVGHMGKAWGRVRTELGLRVEESTNGAHPEPAPREETEEVSETPAPAAEFTPPAALVPAEVPAADPAPPAPEGRAGLDVGAILEENRDLRETYEAEGVHLEELGEEWRIRVNLLFSTRDEAVRTLGKLFAGLA